MKAEYIDHMGSDLTSVNAARVSFDKESEWELTPGFDEHGAYEQEVLSERDYKLVNYLARHGHFTPFTHPQITMRETVPIFVARQRFKHTVGFTYNEVSRRYVDDDPEFYVPDVWRARPEGSVKQGSGDEEIKEMLMYSPAQSYKTSIDNAYQIAYSQCLDVYKGMIEAGVAPEQARMVLPQSMYTSYYVTGSLAAWARAYKLRIDSHAQKEIQSLAWQWANIIEPLFPDSWEALR